MSLLEKSSNGDNELALAMFGDPQHRRLRVHQLIGSGSYGCVFLIDYQGRPATIKVNRPFLGEQIPPQHLISAQVQQLMNFTRVSALAPFVTPILEAQGEFLIMPYYQGQTRAQRIKTLPPQEMDFDDQKIVELIFQLERAQLVPADQGNFAQNIIFDPQKNRYLLLDPGGILVLANKARKYEARNALLYSTLGSGGPIGKMVAFYLQQQLQYLRYAPPSPLFVGTQLHPAWHQVITLFRQDQKISGQEEWNFWVEVDILLGKTPHQAKTQGLIEWLHNGDEKQNSC